MTNDSAGSAGSAGPRATAGATSRTRGHTYGVDEAGRGPILGPMALAVVVLDRKTATKLAARGVQDSKRFGSGAKAQALRASLAAEIHACAVAWSCELVSVETIDEHTFRGQLNRLEQDIALQLLRRLGAAVDATIICDGEYLFRPLREHYPRLKAVNDEAIALGVFGAPYFIVDGEPFWGNDRRAQIEQWLSGHADFDHTVM